MSLYLGNALVAQGEVHFARQAHQDAAGAEAWWQARLDELGAQLDLARATGEQPAAALVEQYDLARRVWLAADGALDAACDRLLAAHVAARRQS